MSLFSRIFGRGVKAANIFMSRIAPDWEVGRGSLKNAKYRDYVKAYTSWVYAAAQRNASAVAQAPLRLYVAKTNSNKVKSFEVGEVARRQLEYMKTSSTAGSYVRKAVEVEEVLEHPFLDLMRSVNDQANQFDTMELMTLFLELTGNAYWYLVNGQMGIPSEIWTLPSHEMTIVPGKDQFIQKFIYKKDQPNQTAFLPEEIIQFKYPNPADAYYGCGPLKAAASAVDMNQYMVEHETSLILNRSVPDTIITADAGTSLHPDQIKSMKEQFETNFKGPTKRGKFAFLPGALSVERLGLTPKEMNYLMSRKATRDEIAAIFGVPVSMLTVENVNRANAESGEYSYQKNTILPRLRRIEQKMNEQLLPRYGNDSNTLFVQFDNPVPQDKEFRLKEIATHLSTKYSAINEERQQDGKGEVEWGDTPIMPVSPFGGLGGGGNGDDDDGKDLDSLVKKIVSETLKKKTADDERRWREFARRQHLHEQSFLTGMRGVFNEQRREVIENIVGLGTTVTQQQLFDIQVWTDELIKVGKPIYVAAIADLGSMVLNELVQDAVMNMEAKPVVRFVDKFTKKYAKVTNQTTLDILRTTIQAEIDKGSSIVKIRKEVEWTFDSFVEPIGTSRASMIARSETIRASNFGAEEAMVQSGVVEGKEWLTALDDRTCPFCKSMNRKVVDLGESYFGQGESLTVQGDDGPLRLNFNYAEVAYPPLHPNCRCTLIPVVIET